MHNRRKRSKFRSSQSGADEAMTSPVSSSSANRFAAPHSHHYSQHTSAGSSTLDRRTDGTTRGRAIATSGRSTSTTTGTSTVDQCNRWRTDASVAAMPRIPRMIREPYVDSARLNWASSHMGTPLQSKVFSQLRVPLPAPPVMPTDPQLIQPALVFASPEIPELSRMFSEVTIQGRQRPAAGFHFARGKSGGRLVMPLVTPLAQMPRVHLSKFGDYPCIVVDFDIADTLPSGAPLPVVATTSGRLTGTVMGPPKTVPHSQVTFVRTVSGPCPSPVQVPPSSSKKVPVQTAPSSSKEVPVPCERREFDVFFSPTEVKPVKSVNVAWAVRHPEELLPREPIRVKTGQRDILARLVGRIENDHPVVSLTPMGAMMGTLSQYLAQHKGKNTSAPQSPVPSNQMMQSSVDSRKYSEVASTSSGAVLTDREQRLLENVRRLPSFDWETLMQSSASTSRDSTKSKTSSRVVDDGDMSSRHSEVVREVEPMETPMGESIDADEHSSSSSPSAASISQSQSREQSAMVEFDIMGEQTSWKSEIACVKYRRRMADRSRASEESSSRPFYSQRSEESAAAGASTDEDVSWSTKSDTARKK